LPYSTSVLSGRETCRQHFLDRLYLFGSNNAVLFRADLVRSRRPFYNEENIHADTEACFALLRTSDFGFVHQVLTFTRVRDSLSTILTAFQTHYAGTLRHLLVHGPHYLTQDELRGRVQCHISQYYRFLGKSLLLGHREILNYHKRKLVETGVGFSWPRLIRGALATISGHVLNPKSTVEKLLKSGSELVLSNDKKNSVSGRAQGAGPGDSIV
jgi:hypothetical protein